MKRAAFIRKELFGLRGLAPKPDPGILAHVMSSTRWLFLNQKMVRSLLYFVKTRYVLLVEFNSRWKKSPSWMVKNVISGIPEQSLCEAQKVHLTLLAWSDWSCSSCSSAIVPMSPYASKFWVFKKSWDQFRIPNLSARLWSRLASHCCLWIHYKRTFDSVARRCSWATSPGRKSRSVSFKS